MAFDDESVDAHSVLAGLVEFSSDMITSFDTDGRITSWNRAAEQTYGFSADEVMGSHVSEFLPNEKKWEATDLLDRVWRGEVISRHESQRVTKNGRLIDTLLTAIPIRNRLGEIVGSSNIIRDITQQKRMQSVLCPSARMEATPAPDGNIGQPMTAMLNYLRMASKIIGDPTWNFGAVDYLDDAMRQIRDCAYVVQTFKDRIADGETEGCGDWLNTIMADFEAALQIAPGYSADPAETELAQRMVLSLTKRQRDVFLRLILGETNKIVGQNMGISPRTVEIHRANILAKLKCRNISGLVRVARSAGLLDWSNR